MENPSYTLKICLGTNKSLVRIFQCMVAANSQIAEQPHSRDAEGHCQDATGKFTVSSRKDRRWCRHDPTINASAGGATPGQAAHPTHGKSKPTEILQGGRVRRQVEVNMGLPQMQSIAEGQDCRDAGDHNRLNPMKDQLHLSSQLPAFVATSLTKATYLGGRSFIDKIAPKHRVSNDFAWVINETEP